MTGILVDDPGWNGKVLDFDWNAYYAIGRTPTQSPSPEEQAAAYKALNKRNDDTEATKQRREAHIQELLRRRGR